MSGTVTSPEPRSSPLPVLIVDDDESVVASLRLLLKQAGIPSLATGDPDQALALAESHAVSLVLQDMNFSRQTSGEEGLTLLRALRAGHPALPIILMTAWGSIELAVEGIKAGANDFLTKPWNNAHLLQLLRTSLSLAAMTESAPGSRDELDSELDFGRIVGEHPALLRVLGTVARVARTDASVLILGESGTGKELIADALHQNSQRAGGPFVKVNLGGVPHSLFESEMFGHVRGAFTDARSDRVGRFQAADGGTIFLDEVGDVDRASQVKLLRVLQDRTFQPVGSSRTLTANVRVISATNRDLERLVAEGQFREDLYYRLNLITIALPTLAERRSDIRLIAQHHLHHVAAMYGTGELTIAPAAMAWLEQRDWPGNIRQLRQTIERAVLMSGQRRLEREHFADPGTATSAGEPADLDHLTLEQMEQIMIEKSLRRHGGNVSRAADALGLSRPALYRRMEKYGITE